MDRRTDQFTRRGAASTRRNMPSGVDPLPELSDNQGVRDNPPPPTAAAEKKANTMANTTHHKDPAADGARGARADNARNDEAARCDDCGRPVEISKGPNVYPEVETHVGFCLGIATCLRRPAAS